MSRDCEEEFEARVRALSFPGGFVLFMLEEIIRLKDELEELRNERKEKETK